jgi:hypothetical protein
MIHVLFGFLVGLIQGIVLGVTLLDQFDRCRHRRRSALVKGIRE